MQAAVLLARIPIAVLISIVVGASGQLMFKAAARTLPPFSELGVAGLLLRMFTTPLILGGLACFFVSAVLWIAAIRQANLSTVYPLVALSYIIIFAGSSLFFGEQVTVWHWGGAALIVCGILMIALHG